jgi:hypothetical protein
MKFYDPNKPQYNEGGACIMAPDEPKSTSTQSIIIFILFVIIMMGLAIAPVVAHYRTLNHHTSPVTSTVIHDTIVVHDTVRIENTPTTFICHGICNGIEDFSGN